MKKTIIGAIIVGVLAVILVLAFRGRGNQVRYQTEPVTRGDMQTAVTASGAVNAVTTVSVGTQVSGRISALYADFNSPVKKGQTIAQIDPALFEAQVNQAQANLLAAQANLAKAKVIEVDAKRTRDRARELLSKNYIAKSDFDTAETNSETAVASTSAAEAQVAQAQAALNLAQTNLRYTRIVSPVDGTVISRNVDVGQTVAASFQTPTLFSIAQDLTKMQINTSVYEADISNIKVGQEADFDVDAYPDVTFKGTVSQVRNAPTTVQNVVTYDVVVRVDNSELKLKPGMTANVSMITSRKTDVLRIPNAALRFRPAEAGRPVSRGGGGAKGAVKAPAGASGGPVVWVLENKKLKRVPVTLGSSDGNYTEVVSGGLKPGEEVVTESPTRPRAPSRSGPRMF